MDDAIMIITLLVALSYVSERLSNIIKTKIPDKYMPSSESTDSAEKERRERRIIYISILSGLIVAALFFFSIYPFPENQKSANQQFTDTAIQTDTTKYTSSETEAAKTEQDIENNTSSSASDSESEVIPFKLPRKLWQIILLGILTGVLLSFGSKFWHDLLGIVLSIKDIRKTAAKEKAITTQTNLATAGLKRFKELTKEEQRVLINDFIRKNANGIFKKNPEIQGLSARRKEILNTPHDYYSLHISVTEKKTDLDQNKMIPGFFNHVSNTNIMYSIPTDVSGVGVNQLTNYFGEGVVIKKLGMSCSRKDHSGGTIGLKVRKLGDSETAYLLSCYHVLCEPEMKKKRTVFNSNTRPVGSATIFSPATGDASDPGNCKEIAEVTEGQLNTLLDVAIAKLNRPNDLDHDYYHSNDHPEGTLKVDNDHTLQNTALQLYGKTSGHKKGKLKDYRQGAVRMKGYPAGKVNYLQDLIVTTKMSQKGDSGASVLTEDNQLIGILVGDNDLESFVIPIDVIFGRLNLELA